MNFDITQSTRNLTLAAPAEQTVTNTTPGADVSRFYGVLAMVVDTGAMSAGATIGVNLQDSDTLGGTYANVPNSTVFMTAATAGFSSGVPVNTDAIRGFVRAVITINGATPSIFAAVRLFGYAYP